MNHALVSVAHCTLLLRAVVFSNPVVRPAKREQ
jgi:hypothetical protein